MATIETLTPKRCVEIAEETLPFPTPRMIHIGDGRIEPPFTIEWRSDLWSRHEPINRCWELQRGGGHVGLYAYPGNAMWAAAQLEPVLDYPRDISWRSER